MIGRAFFLACILNVIGFGQSHDFYAYVVRHLDCRDCYFIPVDVKLAGGLSVRVVVENDDLLDYLKRTTGVDELEYKEFMIDHLVGKRSLTMKDATMDQNELFLVGENIEEHAFRVVQVSQEFQVVANQGCNHLISYYFSPSLSTATGLSDCRKLIKQNAKDLLWRPRYGLIEQNNAISLLFEMEIPTYHDDISGSLKIGYKTLK